MFLEPGVGLPAIIGSTVGVTAFVITAAVVGYICRCRVAGSATAAPVWDEELETPESETIHGTDINRELTGLRTSF